ncbi:MAG: IS630 family transposase [Firmicutes bacterium HGW-Firmicutes-13]|nr:MAG: IS630 family transposase [Firmicutes bacterium HGW-Firmicutes-13]
MIRLRKQGRSNREVAKVVGVTERHTSKIWQMYLREGISAIKLGQRGRRHGGSRKLTKEQEVEIKKLMVDKTPDQLKLSFALWTRDAVRLAIKKLYGADLPLRTITDYLKRWGYTPQKPIKKAYEQNSRRVQQWLDTTYPKIAAQAKQDKAEIHWGDETGVQSDAYNAKGFSPRGKSPIIRLNAKKSSINMISAITNQGKMRFMLYREKMDSEMLIKFMSRLVKDAQRKVFLILDNLRVHHGKVVKLWLETNKEKIEVFYLPSYSPELNPDEYLNGNLKNKIRSGIPARNEKDIVRKTRSFMKTLQKRPQHVKNYFKHPKVAYAA